uniref:TRI27 protein n=1 Tax=Junco hyemalis TaxID=40217 RepID=A0A8C5IG35_JUNHY
MQVPPSSDPGFWGQSGGFWPPPTLHPQPRRGQDFGLNQEDFGHLHPHPQPLAGQDFGANRADFCHLPPSILIPSRGRILGPIEPILATSHPPSSAPPGAGFWAQSGGFLPPPTLHPHPLRGQEGAASPGARGNRKRRRRLRHSQAAMEELPGEASCPICREYFRDPVSIHCGHHFCRACIERCWEWPTGGFACPRCRDTAPRRSLRPSRELQRVLELARRLSRGEALGAEEEEEEEGCRRHREPLEAFCKEDAALLCAICRESRAHRAHTVLPLPEAVREFEEQIQAGLQTLKDDRDKLLELREAEMRRNWECLERTEAERQRILSHFQGLRLCLEELSRRLLARLRRLESDIGRAQEEKVTALTQEISRLESRALELQRRRQQPAGTFLQDISSTLSSLRNENFQLPPSPLPDLENKIQHFREENIPLEETLRRFRDILAFELPEKMTVTLDPSTAHPQLLVAPDGSSVSWERAQDPPGDGPQPKPGTDPGTDPSTDPSVLGREGVTGGRHCWDVQVAPEGSWALGVARETPGNARETPGIGAETLGNGAGMPGSGAETLGNGTETPENGAGTLGSGAETLGSEAGTHETVEETPRNGAGTLGNGAETPRNGAETPGSGTGTLGNGAETPRNGAETPGSGAETPGGSEWELWSMGLCRGQFWALTSLERVPLFLARVPSRVRVALDYERGQVAFFDADERSLIFAFPAASFQGQSVRPWFLVWGEGARITLCP